jgi:hypothetical protein
MPVVEFTESEAVGGTTKTSTCAESLPVPPEPVHAAEYDTRPGTLMESASVPLDGAGPLFHESAHVKAFCDVHVTLNDCPALTDVTSVETCTVGVGGGGGVVGLVLMGASLPPHAAMKFMSRIAWQSEDRP